jgi:hypothetical protein
VKSGEYASLELVPETARPILRGETQVMLHEEPPAPDPASREARSRTRSAPLDSAGPPANLFEALRVWRASAAKTQNVPPYVIFHDTVLRDIAAVRPATLEALGQIKGVGASKLERYGVDVLGVLGWWGSGRYQACTPHRHVLVDATICIRLVQAQGAFVPSLWRIEVVTVSVLPNAVFG